MMATLPSMWHIYILTRRAMMDGSIDGQMETTRERKTPKLLLVLLLLC
jgi:hypothetical protein